MFGASTAGLPPSAPVRYPWYHWRRWGFNFLIVSLAAHLLFGVGATYLIVQTIRAKPKQTFAGQPQSPNAPTRALEHKVQMQKKLATMSAPASVKRITTTSNTKVSLPAMPAMPKLDSQIVPLTMAGMGGTGVGLGLGSSRGQGGASGGGLNFFGLRTGGTGLVGTFYDLKQTSARQPTGMTPQKYAEECTNFVRGGFNSGTFARFFKGPQPLYATQVFTPDIPANLGPSAFHLEAEVQPSMWVVLYIGNISPPEGCTFHFVGAGDDVMMVQFDHKLVLARNWDNPRFGVIDTRWQPQANYNYDFSKIPKGFAKGNAITVHAGEVYPIQVLIGEQPGGRGFAALLIEKEGETYQKDAHGNPILPVFRLLDSPLPPVGPGMQYAPHAEGGPVWKSAAPKTDSIFSQ